jgi:hydroxypyruvate isomerase
MPRFAANLSMLYNEHEFLDRFAAASKDGFQAVEYLFPYAFDAQELKQRLHDNGLQQVLFNAPPGDWDAGERGLACLPGRESEFQSGFLKALDYAEVLNCPRIHVMAGLKPQGMDTTTLEKTYIQNIAWAATEAKKSGRDVLIEPINTRDIPGFFLNYQNQAHDIVQRIGVDNVKVQMDLYHCQIMEGDLATKILQYLPMRHEPDLGELNHPYLFDVIDEVSAACGWEGWIGCEYRPARGAVPNGTHDGLGWLNKVA